MSNYPELSAYQAAALSFLSGLALLAVRLAATILRRRESGDLGPFRGATIDFGAWRIRVSEPRRGSSSPSRRPVSTVEVHSGATAEPKVTDVSSSDQSPERPLIAYAGPACPASGSRGKDGELAQVHSGESRTGQENGTG